MVSVWDKHAHTIYCWRDCATCGVRWHMPEHERNLPFEGWLCPYCRPPEPHCPSCTCYGEVER